MRSHFSSSSWPCTWLALSRSGVPPLLITILLLVNKRDAALRLVYRCLASTTVIVLIQEVLGKLQLASVVPGRWILVLVLNTFNKSSLKIMFYCISYTKHFLAKYHFTWSFLISVSLYSMCKLLKQEISYSTSN